MGLRVATKSRKAMSGAVTGAWSEHHENVDPPEPQSGAQYVGGKFGIGGMDCNQVSADVHFDESGAAALKAARSNGSFP